MTSFIIMTSSLLDPMYYPPSKRPVRGEGGGDGEKGGGGLVPSPLKPRRLPTSMKSQVGECPLVQLHWPVS